jgi:outer membrane protein assembly factor BamD
MSVSLMRRTALNCVAALATALFAMLMVGCSTPPVDESANATAERLYKDAREDMESGSYDRAIKTLERVEGLASGSLLGQQALLDIAYLNWRIGERQAGLTAIERFIKLNPSSPGLDYALYLRGVLNFSDNLGLLGSWFGQDLSERDQKAARESYQAFKQLVDQFPASRYTPDARQRMNFIVNSLASYEVHVARYYLRRGAYVAAANRAQQAVAEYQQTPAVEEALFILVQSYDKLELPKLRDDAERVLRQNFPTSNFLGGAGPGPREKSWWRFWE